MEVGSDGGQRQLESPHRCVLISTTKLIVMSLFSLGLYHLYWFYKQWKLARDRTGENLSPFSRAFFAPLVLVGGPLTRLGLVAMFVPEDALGPP